MTHKAHKSEEPPPEEEPGAVAQQSEPVAKHPAVAAPPPSSKDTVTPLAPISSFSITVQGPTSAANPINWTAYQITAPWGKSGFCTSMAEAVQQTFFGKGGTAHSGRMGAYFSSQATNATEVN